ncbi:sulfotransferase domain-containing protein [Octadecabacter sp. 1_MG-2023]|uniref:sulfotransferase domain-containing protein n=1 Tax=unclassified Octadecabacter TaxID=196158 RepID=UPI001C08CCF8|nr:MULTISPECIES: sulfotransferase domain-containing protein [unclassified Octadecabacter]MBU2994059.1 sulfotransferase domain-containing protein [Octadecabacter sp. B2R22]MDO6736087.1 sulfotransferase domain-containing protein [Octadecabacter sp. 1_MG-2023]
MTQTSVSTQDWRAALADHPVHKTDPIGDPYVLGRWHKDRASWRGYAFEARVALKSLLVRNTPAKFLIVARPRSGTSLLRELLNQVVGLHCDGEVLHHAVCAPHRFLNQLAGIKQASIYGSKVLSYQMFEVQMIRDPAQFLEGLVADDYTLIHVRRDTFDQALSLTVAQAGHGYHMRKSDNAATNGPRVVHVDEDIFARQLRHHSAVLDYEDLLMSRLPHLRIQYEDDLKQMQDHQKTIDRICAALGHPPSPVTANLVRTSTRTEITNIDALRACAETVLTENRRDP